MHIILNDMMSGPFLVNSDSIRVSMPNGRRTTIHFNTGQRVEVSESIYEIQAKTGGNQEQILDEQNND